MDNRVIAMANYNVTVNYKQQTFNENSRTFDEDINVCDIEHGNKSVNHEIVMETKGAYIEII